MANKKQALKYIRKTEKRTQRNRVVRSRIKTLAKKVSQAASEDDAGGREAVARDLQSALDKAAKRGIIHPNKASRDKSRLARRSS